MLEENGYTITSTCTAVKNPQETKFQYRDQLWGGADMVALGVASFGHLGGIHYQNVTHFEDYCSTSERGDSLIRRALLTTEEERFIREFILQWKLGSVDPITWKNLASISMKDTVQFLATGKVVGF